MVVFFIEKGHILRITHLKLQKIETQYLVWVKLCIQHFLSLELSPTLLGNLYKKM